MVTPDPSRHHPVVAALTRQIHTLTTELHNRLLDEPAQQL